MSFRLGSGIPRSCWTHLSAFPDLSSLQGYSTLSRNTALISILCGMKIIAAHNAERGTHLIWPRRGPALDPRESGQGQSRHRFRHLHIRVAGQPSAPGSTVVAMSHTLCPAGAPWLLEHHAILELSRARPTRVHWCLDRGLFEPNRVSISLLACQDPVV
ncbi:uncharacterized protein PV07_08618 [Cladophialophora immunda]|uniref:Uncharacterized protein n=1 Tax=Cladophialophora immunda TaxID=569365 RepID=A0A0D2C4Q8_9EURO|nr:uncharacterized protein PV07_08618 [Cladophialophora immunda]KIW25445.1 hypothetical protein PV07_08618 [Cladophialophora immunda]